MTKAEYDYARIILARLQEQHQIAKRNRRATSDLEAVSCDLVKDIFQYQMAQKKRERRAA